MAVSGIRTHNSAVKNKPTYAVTSVDHALRLVNVLQVEGSISVSEAARRLGVARSTAHRLLGMLVYRDFATQRADRTYGAGPLLRLGAAPVEAAAGLRGVALPHMERLRDRLRESVNLQVRTGDHVRFLVSVEGPQVLRVGSREGMAHPLHQSSVGRALLANLPAAEQAQAIAALTGDATGMRELAGDLVAIRSQGFAVNRGVTERGVTAIGCPLAWQGGTTAGLSLAMPETRFEERRLPQYAKGLLLTARAIDRDLAAAGLV